ncbi:MAG: RNA polymerase sigma factor [Bradymonadaceae bacterium]
MKDLKAQLEGLHEDAFQWSLACTRGDRHEAEEVLQTVYLKVIEGKARFDERASLKTWLFAVVRRTATERHRRRRYRGLLLMKWSEEPRESKSARADEAMERDERQRRLRRALDDLSPRQREVLELVFYHDLTVEEAGEVLGISVGSARTHYHRGKKELQRRLESEGEIWMTKMTGS